MKTKKLLAIKHLFAQIPDGDGERALRRVVLHPALILAYVYFIPVADSVNLGLVFSCIALHFLTSLLVLCALWFGSGRSVVWRLLGLVIDVVIVSSLIAAMGEFGIVFVGVYMWICQDYVHQYGRLFCWIALAANLPALVIAFSMNDYWNNHPQIGMALLATILLLPFCFNRVFEQIREASVVKSKFLTTISHEIRTPLNAIVGLTELLKKSRLTNEQAEWVRTLSICEDMLLSLINNVLDLAKIEAGAITIKRKPFLLSMLIANLADFFKNAADEKGLHLSFDLAVPDLDELIGDSDYLNQVLVNLIANSIKFTYSGTILIRVTQKSRSADKVELLWEIVDTGIGIPDGDIGRIFDAFSQVDANDKSARGGTGLGTAISKELVERMGGKIGVESTIGKGSTFWFSLEFGIAPSAPSPVLDCNWAGTSSPSVSSCEPTPSGFRILLIEDNPINRSVMAKILQGLGHTVCAMETAETAMVCLACVEFDVILLDMVLPRLCGVELVRRINRLELQWRPPVFILTANAFSSARKECEAAGTSVFLIKPITSQYLAEALTTVCRRTSPTSPFIFDSPVDPVRVNAQLLLGEYDFSYVIELAVNWFPDFIDNADLLVRALANRDKEKVAYLLHNIEGGALEIGARAIAGLCQTLRKDIASASESEQLAAVDALNAAFVATSQAFGRLWQMSETRTSSSSNTVSHADFLGQWTHTQA